MRRAAPSPSAAARRSWLASAAVALLAAGCGSSGHAAATSRRAATPPPATTTAPPAQQLVPALPQGVPTTGHGAADPASAHVITAWLAALDKGDEVAAAKTFGRGARVQNGTPVLTLQTFDERRGFQASLPCGAVAQELKRNGPWTIVTYLLTQRKGGDCMGAEGNRARGVIRVQGGRIVEWYRLPDPPGQPAAGGTGGEET